MKKEKERAVEKCLQDSAEDGDGSPIVVEECQPRVCDLFSKIMRPSKGRTGRSLRSKAESLVATWLDQDSKQDYTDMTFLGEPVLVKLFNTIPPFPPVQQSKGFSLLADILKHKRGLLSRTKIFLSV